MNGQSLESIQGHEMNERTTASSPSSRIFTSSRAANIMTNVSFDHLPVNSSTFTCNLLSQGPLTLSPRLFLFHLCPTAEDNRGDIRWILWRLSFEKVRVGLRIVGMSFISLRQDGLEHLFGQVDGCRVRPFGSEDTGDRGVVLTE